MKNKNLLILLVLGLIIVLFSWLYKSTFPSFPITYKVCGAGYVDCTEVAKFKERWQCEYTQEKWDWRCDETDKNRIICTPGESMIAVGICE